MLLSREQGATMDDLIEATGWLPHTTQGALTGLRQCGYAISRTRAENNRTIYRVPPLAKAASVQDAPETAEV
jgi:DNA-binding MarR family transcriptional regulator